MRSSARAWLCVVVCGLVVGGLGVQLAGSAAGAVPRASARRVAEVKRADRGLEAGAELRSWLSARVFRGAAVHVAGVGRRAPFGRLGSQVTSMRRADSDTYLAASGKLVTKIYPSAVNYRGRGGRYVPINARLVRRSGRYVQAANDLGIALPATAAQPARLGRGRDALAVSVVGGQGAAMVRGTTQTFAHILSGDESVVHVAAWRAGVAGHAAGRGR